MHANTYFDLVIQGCEELSHELDYSVEEIVVTGGVPYAPAAVEFEIERYAGFEDTIVTVGRTLYVSDRSFGFEYAFDRQSDSRRLATARVTHVTITPEGAPEPLPERVIDKLESFRDGPSDRVEPPDDTAFDSLSEHPTFERSITFRTPMIEAVDFGYFEDYFRQMEIAFEEYLADRGISIRDGGEERYPFFPSGGNFSFNRPIRFEDVINVRGRLVDVTPNELVVQYELTGDGEDDVRVRGSFRFGCFDADGERCEFPDDVLDSLSASSTSP